MRALAPRSLLLAALVATGLAGCARAPDLIGVVNPEIPVASVADLTRQRIFMLTTREASQEFGALYSSERASALGLASVDVTIPPTHVVGELERPTRLPPDPRTEFTVIDPAIYATDAAFIAAINRDLAALPPSERKLLVFVHGYNNTTSDAVLRLGQFVEDAGFEGVPILFTWASAANASRYVYDLNSALVARVKLGEMAAILAQTDATSVDIFAHSMGGFLAMEGMVRAQQEGRLGRGGRIDHIVLASPDIDIDVFRTQIAALPEPIVGRMFVLVSEDDAALRFSRRLAGGVPRVGAADITELEQLGLTVIDLTEIDDSSSGSHSKFAGSPEVVQILGAGLNSVGRFGEDDTPGLGRLLDGVPIRIVGN